MTQYSLWLAKYNEVLDFIATNHRTLSRYRLEEHNMLNWLKANRKLMNAGELHPSGRGSREDINSKSEDNLTLIK